MRNWEVITRSPEETREMGRLLGSLITSPVAVFLYGELGAGKTCLTKGLGAGLAGGEDVHVSSPSYTLMNHYPGRLDLYHFDLYRLSGSEDLFDIGFEEYLREEGVMVVEWADKADLSTEDGLFVHLQHLDESRRKVLLEARGKGHQELLRQLSERWSERREVHD